MTWMFAAISLNPSVQSYANLSDTQRDTINHKFASLAVRLLSTDCHDEAVAALKYEGAIALESSFALLGQVAARGLMSDPHTASAMQSLGTDVDKAKLNALLDEAGLAH